MIHRLPPPLSKSALRQQLLALRRSVPPEAIAGASEAVADAIGAFPPFQHAQHIASYAAVRGELPTAGLHAIARRNNKSVYLPKTDSGRSLTFHRWSGEPLTRGPLGIPTPEPSAPPIAGEDLHLVLVPGLAFDRAGRRLGHGAGYYDRFLASTAAFRLGVCWSWQVVAEVPTEAHDAPVHAVLTEVGLWFADQSTGRYSR